MDRARTAISGWFGRLPQTDCVMAQIPGPGAEEAPLAFYLPPTVDGSRPGTYFVNTTEPATRTRSSLRRWPSTNPSQAIICRSPSPRNSRSIPDSARRRAGDGLRGGVGPLHRAPRRRNGSLQRRPRTHGRRLSDSWRAGRLVVDTGMHASAWSRDEAIEYLIMNSPQAPNNIETEVDRYIGWPGQALAYKLGQRVLPVARRGTAATRAGPSTSRASTMWCWTPATVRRFGGAGRELAAGRRGMISIDLARRLRDAGLEWHPADGDLFDIPDRDLDEHTFSISEMTVDVRHVQGGRQIAFNGAVEWALDAIMEHERHPAALLSRSLRVLLGDTFVGLQRDASGYHCTTGNDLTFSAPVAADAYGLALLDHLNTQSGSAGTGL